MQALWYKVILGVLWTSFVVQSSAGKCCASLVVQSSAGKCFVQALSKEV